MFLWLAFHLIIVHNPDGREIDISLDEITSMSCRLPNSENRLFADGVNTVINLSDGKHVGAAEDCAEVRKLIRESGRDPP